MIPGLTALVRWRTYRYVQRQSLSFFQDDFAGCVAQKVMQTGMAVRESVVNVVDGIWFLFIYLTGTLALVVGLDWRMALPLVLWTIGYGATIYFMVPPVRVRSAAVAEADSALSGRLVGSFTNIQAVKLFSEFRAGGRLRAEELRAPACGDATAASFHRDDDGRADGPQ
ncbi:ABC transporter transmembrane domain-containing protein [Breoghania sp.]|uniref:ABC transporter transmembrane domain-containing protein n=1 Tax=Breoghania sp. TaxID=2065378 RepID=UPI0032048B04